MAHGGQVLLSLATAERVREALPPHAGLRDLGSHRLKDLQQPEQIFQLFHPALRAETQLALAEGLRIGIEPARVGCETRVDLLILFSRRVGLERQHVATAIDDGELVDQPFKL